MSVFRWGHWGLASTAAPGTPWGVESCSVEGVTGVVGLKGGKLVLMEHRSRDRRAFSTSETPWAFGFVSFH